jgi:hypothetical protein
MLHLSSYSLASYMPLSWTDMSSVAAPTACSFAVITQLSISLVMFRHH